MDQELKELLLSMQSDIKSMSKRMDTMEDDLQSVKADVAQIPDIRRDINLILEGQTGVNEKFQKLDEVADRVEDIQNTVNAMEAVTKQNCTDIKELRIAK